MDRSLQAITQRACVLGIRADYHFWTEEEEKKLQQCYIELGRSACFELFPNKTRSSIISKIDSLDIKPKVQSFSLKEIQILKENYEIKSWQEMQELLPERSRGAIAAKASELGLKSGYNKPWTEEEVILLKQGVELINRSFNQCVSKCRELNIYHGIYRPMGHYWSEEEDNLLKKYYPIMGREVSQILNRSPESCTARASKLKLKANKHKPNVANGKRVLCLETGEIFESCASASRKYHCGDLSPVLKGRRETAGSLTDGTKLHWKYVEETAEETTAVE